MAPIIFMVLVLVLIFGPLFVAINHDRNNRMRYVGPEEDFWTWLKQRKSHRNED